MRALAGFLIGFLALTAFFSLLERLFPSIPGQKRWRRGAGTDLVYWVATPLVFKPISRALTVAPLVIFAIVATRGMVVKGADIKAWIEAGRGPIGALPRGAQAVLGL